MVVLGDSYTFSYGVDITEAYPTVMQTLLSREIPELNIQVFNLGIPGYTTRQELATLRQFGPILEPDLVLLGYLLNDIQGQYEGAEVVREGFRGVLFEMRERFHFLRFVLPRIAQFARTLGLDLKTTATAELDEYLDEGLAWRRNQGTLLELIALSEQLGASPAIVVPPYIIDLDKNHPLIPAYEVVVNFFQSNNVKVVNSFDYFRGMKASDLWIHPFDGHPNALGQALIAQASADLIKEMRKTNDAKDRFDK